MLNAAASIIAASISMFGEALKNSAECRAQIAESQLKITERMFQCQLQASQQSMQIQLQMAQMNNETELKKAQLLLEYQKQQESQIPRIVNERVEQEHTKTLEWIRTSVANVSAGLLEERTRQEYTKRLIPCDRLKINKENKDEILGEGINGRVWVGVYTSGSEKKRSSH